MALFVQVFFLKTVLYDTSHTMAMDLNEVFHNIHQFVFCLHYLFGRN